MSPQNVTAIFKLPIVETEMYMQITIDKYIKYFLHVK